MCYQPRLYEYLEDIHVALDAGAFYSALALALTIPDICGAIEFPELVGESHSGDRYRGWFDEWCGRLHSRMTAADCWAARCCYLHLASEEFVGRAAKKAALSRIQFTRGKSGGVWVSEYSKSETGGKVVRIPLEDFCHDMTTSADGWLCTRFDDKQVMSDVAEVLEIRRTTSR
jgi:hypothetical protein